MKVTVETRDQAIAAAVNNSKRHPLPQAAGTQLTLPLAARGERNRSELARHGSLQHHGATPEGAGPATTGPKEKALTLEAISGLLEPLRQDISTLNNRVDDLVPRRNFSEKVVWQWVHVIDRRYNGECPCCRKEKVLDDEGNRLRTSHLDHFRGREHNRETDGWLVCQACNSVNLKNSEFKNAARKHFEVFQDYRRDLFAGHPPKVRMAETRGRLFE